MECQEKTAKRDQIITELYKRKDIDNICDRIGKNWAEELKGELFLLVCEINVDKLIEMYESGYLTFWIFRTVINMGYDSHPFAKNIKGKNPGISIVPLEQAENIPIDDADNLEGERLEILPGALKTLDFFHQDIIKNYLSNGNNISKTAKVLNINRKYVGKLVRESKAIIEQYVKDQESANN